jgi:hypothetical protein
MQVEGISVRIVIKSCQERNSEVNLTAECWWLFIPSSGGNLNWVDFRGGSDYRWKLSRVHCNNRTEGSCITPLTIAYSGEMQDGLRIWWNESDFYVDPVTQSYICHSLSFLSALISTLQWVLSLQMCLFFTYKRSGMGKVVQFSDVIAWRRWI